MRIMKTTWPLIILCALAPGTACGGSGTAPSAPEPTQDRSAVVISGADMTGNLLDGIRTRVRTMTIRRQSGACPTIMFRGTRSAERQGNPSVYVDGTLMSDTCILQQIPADDVDFVEIYPSGVSSRPNIRRNPFGVIFVQRIRR
jgi:hypothetical protein